MPTGYTADVADGTVTELEPFVMRLARGMGALIMMRDDPSDATIPERFEPSDYHVKKLAELRAERDRVRSLSDKDAQGAADKEFADWQASKARAEAEHVERRNRYNSMIAKVVQWEGAPEGIKEFGLEQLHRGLEWDCREPFEYWSKPPERDAAEWREAQLAELHRQLEYHAVEDAEERERAERRNSWLAQLRKSLAAAEEPAEAQLK